MAIRGVCTTPLPNPPRLALPYEAEGYSPDHFHKYKTGGSFALNEKG